MRLLTIVTFLICLVAVFGLTAQAGPKIDIPDPVFNWGRVCQNATISHTFWIKSVGDDTLRILKVVPGCGCTKAPLQDSVLAPGDSTRLDIFLSTRSYRGYVTKRPYLVTNISDEKVYLKIISHLVTDPEKELPLFIQPQRVDVSQFTVKPRRKAKFLIENRGDQDYKITLIDWAVDYFDVELPEMVKAGETVEGQVIVHEDKIPSQFELSLTFAIDDDSQSRYTIPVKRVFRIKKGAASASEGN